MKGKCRCVQSQKACGDECVDTQVNWRHCGGCGKSCKANQVCSSGSCLPKCPPLTPNQCFGGCFDLKMSPRHCGKCGNICIQGQACVDGKCQIPQEQTKEPANEPQGEGDAEEASPEPVEEPITETTPEPTCISKTEVCDNQDNDCDGKADNFTISCYEDFFTKPGIGECKAGTRFCSAGSYGVCVGQIRPKPESCNKKDDNCNGKVDEGCVYTVAGTPGKSGHNNGSAKSALFSSPYGLAFDTKGNLYIADLFNHVIRKIDTNGIVSTFAGTPTKQGYKDGPAKNALFSSPYGLAFDTKGNLYVADSGNNSIRKIDTSGTVSTFAGTPTKQGYKDGPAKNALFGSPYGLAFDTKGNLYVSDGPEQFALPGNNVIRKVDTKGIVSTFAGTFAKRGHKDGPVKSALFGYPGGIVSDGKGNLYIADLLNNVIRKIDVKGVISTPVGTPGKSGHKDGFAKSALFNSPVRLIFDTKGNLYIADSSNNVIRKAIIH